MAIGINDDAEYIRRSGIPSGGAGTVSDGGFANVGLGVWLYRASSGNSYALTSEGYIISGQAGAREIKIGYDNTFGDGSASAPLLQVVFNSGGGTGAVQTFVGANFLDEWVYHFIYEASATQHAGYIRLSAPTTVVKISRANDNAGSQYVNDLTFGNGAAGGECVAGHYAYARAIYATGINDATIIAAAAATAPVGPEWGVWLLADNTDNQDATANNRDLTLSSGLTSEADPDLGSAPIEAVAADTITFSDSAVSITTRLSVAVDTITLSDSAVSVTTRLSVAADTLTLTDSAVSVTTRLNVAADTVSFSDSAVALPAYAVDAADTIIFTDSAVSISARISVAADTLTLSDSAESISVRLSAAEDTINFSDSAEGDAVTGVTAEAEDTLTLSDAAVSVTSRLSVAEDTLLMSDTAVSETVRLSVAEDTLTFSDSSIAATGIPASAEDTVVMSDSAVSSTERVSAASDTVNFNDSAESILTKLAEASDGISFSDSAEAFSQLIATGTDSIIFADSAIGNISGTLPETILIYLDASHSSFIRVSAGRSSVRNLAASKG
jgi:hypothetical protein